MTKQGSMMQQFDARPAHRSPQDPGVEDGASATATGPTPVGEFSPVLEEFASVIAHELNTPLTVVLGATTTLLKLHPEGLSDEQRRLLQMIRRNTDLASLLLHRLSLARDIEAESVRLTLADVDLGEVVTESVADLKTAILGAHPVQVDIGELPTIRADETAVREIVFNLLSNASKYSAKRAPIAVVVSAVDDTAQVLVRNHGTGVTPGDTERIFEKFLQGDPDSPGAGLGLFISRGLARAHGGELSVQPATESGSEFRLSLPLPG